MCVKYYCHYQKNESKAIGSILLDKEECTESS